MFAIIRDEEAWKDYTARLDAQERRFDPTVGAWVQGARHEHVGHPTGFPCVVNTRTLNGWFIHEFLDKTCPDVWAELPSLFA